MNGCAEKSAARREVITGPTTNRTKGGKGVKQSGSRGVGKRAASNYSKLIQLDLTGSENCPRR